MSGSIYGLNLDLSASLSIAMRYTTNLEPNSTAYLGYKAYYPIESGTREKINNTTGKVESRNSYTYHRPLHGQYKLIYVK